jgi:DNA-binding NarL/FixJ family response regulator
LPEIKEAVEDLAKGRRPDVAPDRAKGDSVFQHHSDAKKKPESDLTAREQDIVNGLVDGLSYKMIADRYDISIDTVRAHIRNIYKKAACELKSRGDCQVAAR